MLRNLLFILTLAVLVVTPAQAAALVVRAGTTITLDVSNITSVNVKVLLDSRELIETPVLGSNIGLKVPIPKDATNGSHKLTVKGLEKGEETSQYLVIVDGTSPLDARFWLSVGGTAILGFLLGFVVRKRRRVMAASVTRP